eukprot:GHVT01092331.1.p1 GENE.GHVT01092331.1~~GHVT01092331.1.p1  ORF type:complete len:130 (+),score=0.57 GHVT01092331.1:424-813(+)
MHLVQIAALGVPGSTLEMLLGKEKLLTCRLDFYFWCVKRILTMFKIPACRTRVLHSCLVRAYLWHICRRPEFSNGPCKVGVRYAADRYFQNNEYRMFSKTFPCHFQHSLLPPQLSQQWLTVKKLTFSYK